MPPSPPLGPPLLSESPPPPPFWGIPLLLEGGGAFGAAGFGAGCGAAGAAGAGAFGAAEEAPLPPADFDDLPVTWFPAADTANQRPPNAVRPSPFVWPGFVSFAKR